MKIDTNTISMAYYKNFKEFDNLSKNLETLRLREKDLELSLLRLQREIMSQDYKLKELENNIAKATMKGLI